MIEAFKTGGKLPKRVVWEIVLGVKAIVDKERSMVSRTVDEGVVCDIIGDTHGVSVISQDLCEVADGTAIL
jgi:serine/threonine-protein phosphatase 5